MERAGRGGGNPRPALTTTHTLLEVHAMAIDHSIPPFPVDVDRVAFGHWISGFTDGEGCFRLGFHRHRKDRTFVRPMARFAIEVRFDDRAILEEIRSYWRCGQIYLGQRNRSHNMSAVLSVVRIAEMARIIVPHFLTYPLRAKKQRDFEIWRLGVEMVASRKGQPISPAYIEEFGRLSDHLKKIRKADGGKLSVPSPRRATHAQRVLF